MKNFVRLAMGRLLARLLRFRGQPYAFQAGPLMVVSPHADDETLGCGGLLAIKQSRGEPASVVYITDSAGSPEAGGNALQAERRRREALAALAALGVPAERAHFLQAPDGRLNRLNPDERWRLVNALAAHLRSVRPAEVFLPYLGGGSTEHDATVGLTMDALKSAELTSTVWQYPVWAWWDPRRLVAQLGRPHENFHLILGAVREAKLAALACHASQVEPAGPSGVPALPPVLAKLTTGPAEFFFLRK